MKIIRDGRALNELSKKYNFTYDKNHKYITSNHVLGLRFNHNGQEYMTIFFDGCFNPYLVAKQNETTACLNCGYHG
jgi:hypothetical protein